VALGLLLNARRTLLPLPLLDGPRGAPGQVLPPLSERPASALADERIGVALDAAGVSTIGAARAFEEASLRPAGLSACSASVLWAAMWGAGMTAEEMADRSLSWAPEYELGVQWLGLPRLAVSALRGFSGLPKAAALEQLFDRRVWRMSAGATEVPLHTMAWDVDDRQLVTLGSETTPELTLGELARIAVAEPRRDDAVRVEGRFYADAGHANPALDASLADADRVLAPAVDGRDGFYDLFLDRRAWPELINRGYAATVQTLYA
jgi:NTE family protein